MKDIDTLISNNALWSKNAAEVRTLIFENWRKRKTALSWIDVPTAAFPQSV